MFPFCETARAFPIHRARSSSTTSLPLDLRARHLRESAAQANMESNDPEKELRTAEEGEPQENAPSPPDEKGVDVDRKDTDNASKSPKFCVLVGLLVLLLTAVVVPTAIHLRRKNADAVVFTPLYDTSKLPLYNAAILEGYDTLESFEEDLTIAAQHLVNNAVGRSSGDTRYAGGGWGSRGSGPSIFEGEIASAEDASSPEAGAPSFNRAASTDAQDDVGDDVDDFGTNNQEGDVEEGDIIVASKQAVYAAYGNYILSWNSTTGKRFQSVKVVNDVADAISDYDYYSYVSIRSMLLHEQRLLVIVDGMFDEDFGQVTRVLGSYRRTRLLIYDVGDDGSELNLITKKDINGYFSAVRAEEGKVFVVTMSGITTYHHLVDPFNVAYGSQPEDLEAYYSRAKKDADETYIPQFVEQMERELTTDGVFPRTVRLCRWQTEHASDLLGDFVYSNGFVNSVALVTAFDLPSAPIADELVGVHTTAAFLPSGYGQTYATSGMLLIATTGYDYSERRQGMVEKTYMLALALDGATSKPHAVGAVDGYFLNQHSFDIANGSLRVATSIRNLWFWGRDEVVRESSTENYVITMDLPSVDADEVHEMAELDRLKLGKPNELFTAVRFFDSVAYAVTFERIDPFYVLNVTDSSNLEVLAEVEITGFSAYLHSMNDENCLILAIGQEANQNGGILGVQISVYDACDVDNINVTRHTVELEDNVYSSSNALWDIKSVRFNRDTGRLIIPVDVHDWQNEANSFHGFKIYVVTADSIVEDCSVEAGNNLLNGDVCYGCRGVLEPRSMIFGGDLMTTKAHVVTSTDLNTCEQVWQFGVTVPEDDAYGCCNYWAY